MTSRSDANPQRPGSASSPALSSTRDEPQHMKELIESAQRIEQRADHELQRSRFSEGRGSEGPACPHCGHTASKVLESRSSLKRHDYYRRRRQCLDCHQRFTTHEVVKKVA